MLLGPGALWIGSELRVEHISFKVIGLVKEVMTVESARGVGV